MPIKHANLLVTDSSQGNPLYSDDIGKMCYNAAKNWQLDWYDGRKKLIEPLVGDTLSTSFQLVGIAEYEDGDRSIPVVAKLETGTSVDFFVGFNRAIGINEHNDEADDMLTIVQSDEDGENYSQSWLKATLTDGELYTLDNFGGSGNQLVVRVTNIDRSSVPWIANVVAGINGATPQPTSVSDNTDSFLEPRVYLLTCEQIVTHSLRLCATYFFSCM